jgi:hypothetical protein
VTKVVEADFLWGLITDDPLDVVWRSLLALWTEETQIEPNLSACYRQGERVTDQLERFLYDVYPELYLLLSQQARTRNPLLEYFPSQAGFLVIADGLSVRECPHLVRELGKRGYRPITTGYSLSAIPSESEFFIEKSWGRRIYPNKLPPHLNGIHTHYVNRLDTQLPVFPGEPFLVWLRWPDGNLKSELSTDLSPLLNDVWIALQRVLDTYAPHRFVLSSDHGYILGTEMWKLGKSVGKLMRQAGFERGRRYSLGITDEQVGSVLSLVVQDEAGAYVRGRHSWLTTAGRLGYHGGVSLTEILTPLAIFERKG